MANKNSANNDVNQKLHQIMAAAMHAHRAGDLFEADLMYTEVLDIDPDHLQALRLHGILARDRGDLDKSLVLLRRAHALAPTDPKALGEIALVQMAVGELHLAEDSLRKALALDPQSVKILVNLGALLQHRGHAHAAITCYQQALRLEPDDLQLQCNLAKALAETGLISEALACCASALESSDGHPSALAVHGAVLIDAGQYANARSVLTEATELNPGDDMALVNLALCCHELGDQAAAATALRQAVHQNPCNARAVADLANCLTALDDINGALDLCAEFLHQYPGERLVIAAQALALLNAGQTAAADVLTNCNTLVKGYDLPCPAVFDDIEAFNAALTQAIRTDRSLLDNPVSKSTYGGAQTGELDLTSPGCLAEFGAAIHRAVNIAIAEWLAAGLQQHPLMAPATEEWSLRAWGAVLRIGGRQTPHIHPLGWVSGVYYVQIPAAMMADDPQAGWLEFGQPPERFFCNRQPTVKRFEPVAGKLLLFPSWLWHQTLPFQADGERISIAFDVMPKSALRLL